MMDYDGYGCFFFGQRQGIHKHFRCWHMTGTCDFTERNLSRRHSILLAMSQNCCSEIWWISGSSFWTVHRISLPIFSFVSRVPVGTLDVGGSTMSIMSTCSPAVASWQVPFPRHGSVTKSHTVEIHQSRQVRPAPTLLGWSQYWEVHVESAWLIQKTSGTFLFPSCIQLHPAVPAVPSQMTWWDAAGHQSSPSLGLQAYWKLKVTRGHQKSWLN